MLTKEVAARRSRPTADRKSEAKAPSKGPSVKELISLVSEDIQGFIQTGTTLVDEGWLKRSERHFDAVQGRARVEASPLIHPRDLIARATRVARAIAPPPQLQDRSDFFCVTRRRAPYRDMVGVPSTFEDVPCSPAFDDAILRGVFTADGSFHLSAKVGSFYGVTCAGSPWPFGDQNVASGYLIKQDSFDPQLSTTVELSESADLRIPMAPHVVLWGGDSQFGYAGFYGIASLMLVGITASGIKRVTSHQRFAYGFEAGLTLESPEYVPAFTLNTQMVSRPATPILSSTTVLAVTLAAFRVPSAVIAEASMLGSGALKVDELRSGLCARDSSSTL